MLLRATNAFCLLLLYSALVAIPAAANEELASVPQQSSGAGAVPATAEEVDEASEDTTETAAEGLEEAVSVNEDIAGESWDEDTSWQQGGLNYFGSLTYWHVLDRGSGTDKDEGELALSFSFKDYRGRLRIGNYETFANRMRDLRIEKYEIGGPLGKLEFSLGTFPQTLGKGMVLSGIEQRGLGVDNEIEGFRLSFPGKKISAAGFIGSHKREADLGATKVFGGRVEAKPWDWFIIGGNTFTYKPVKVGIGGAPNTRTEHHAYSVDAALQFKAVSAYFEYMRMNWAQNEDGRGMYGNLSLSFPGVGLTYEYKDYWLVDGVFSAPPPVRYDEDHAAADLRDEKGYGLIFRLTPFKNGSLIEAHYAQANVREMGMPMTEFIIAYNSPTEKRFNWMIQRSYHNDLFYKERAYYAEAGYAWNNYFTTQLACELSTIDEGMGSYDYQNVSVDFGYGGWLTLAISQEKQERGFNPNPQRWTIAELKLQQSGKQELSIAYGKRPAGVVCLGGICRLEPEFDGWKLEYRLFF